MTTPPRPPPRSRWYVIALAAITFLALIALAWAGSERTQARAAQDIAARSFERERARLLLLSAVQDADAAQRGFLLTGDPAFLHRYAAARSATWRPGAPPGTVSTVLARLVDLEFAELDGTIALYRAGDHAAVARETRSGRGQRIMDRLRDEVMRANASGRVRAAAVARAYGDARRSQVVMALLSGVIVAALVAGVWHARRGRRAGSVIAQEMAARDAAILAALGDTLLVVAPDGTIEITNAAAGMLLGYAPDELAGRDLGTVLRSGAAGGGLHALIGLNDGRLARSFIADQPVQRRDGGEVRVDVAIGVMRRADGDRLLLSLRDASARAQVERARDELISTVSHELRTPLTSVVGSLALLRAAENDWSPQARRLVAIADNNARRLIRLINDMLDIDRLESGQLTIARAPVDLRTITAQAALDAEGLAQGRGVTLIDVPAATPVVASGDHGRLLQVVTNLVSNAIQASRDGQTVTLGASIVGDRAIVRVADRGGGIPAALRPRLFHRFQSQRASGGTGLGLAISREIVRRLDGMIWFEDRVGGGTRFVFDLPAVSWTADRHDTRGDRPIVLHVDDDPDLRDMVASALADVATVVPAASLAAARATLHSGLPALALLDMQVVDGHGPELIPELVDRCGHALPIVILSGQEVPKEMAARAAVVLTKGRHDMIELVATVRRLLPPADGSAR